MGDETPASDTGKESRDEEERRWVAPVLVASTGGIVGIIAVMAFGPNLLEAWKGRCPEYAWYEGGTLFKATSAEWRGASSRDRLATAAEWAYRFIEDMSPSVQTTDELFPFAREIRDCLDTAFKEGSVEVSRASDAAAFCAVYMKDTFQQMLNAQDAVRRARAAS